MLLGLSDKYVYRKENFNATELTVETEKLLTEFGIQKPKNILFSYGSNMRMAAAFLMRKNEVDLRSYKKAFTDKNQEFYFKRTEDDRNVYLENIYPYKNRFIRVVERNMKTKNQDKYYEQTFIFPEIKDLPHKK